MGRRVPLFLFWKDDLFKIMFSLRGLMIQMVKPSCNNNSIVQKNNHMYAESLESFP